MDDDLNIPDFLQRSVPLQEALRVTVKYRERDAKIPYPKNGYKARGLRKDALARHRERLRRRAERMRNR